MPTGTTSGSKQPRVPGEFGVRGKSIFKDGLVQIIEELLRIFFSLPLFRGCLRLL